MCVCVRLAVNWTANDNAGAGTGGVCWCASSPSTPPARFGESFYSFLPRCVGGSFVSAWRLEVDRMRDRNLPFYSNEMLWYVSGGGKSTAVKRYLFSGVLFFLFL